VSEASQADRVPLAQPDLGPEEEAEVLSVLRSGRLSLGARVEELEKGLAAFTELPWAAAVSSGTAGLHLAVRALGLGPQDCVVTPSFSFIASANCIRYEGAEPVFVDIDPETLCLSPESLAKYIASCNDEGGSLRDPESGRRVAGVVSVDAFGHPADLASISSLVRPRGL
jgi:perosamine synthetase